MSNYRMFLFATALLALPFMSQGALATELQKTPDNRSGGGSPDKINMGKNPANNQNLGEKDRSAPFRKFLTDLSQEDFERLKKLSKENPEEFKEEVRKRTDSKKTGYEGSNSKSSELAEKFRKSKDEKEKSNIKNELRNSVKEEFDRKMEINLKRLDQAEKQLGEFKAKLDDRKRKADEIIDSRVNDLLKDPNIKW